MFTGATDAVCARRMGREAAYRSLVREYHHVEEFDPQIRHGFPEPGVLLNIRNYPDLCLAPRNPTCLSRILKIFRSIHIIKKLDPNKGDHLIGD